MRTLLKTIVVQTPDLGPGVSAEFRFYETPGTAPTPGGHEKFRLVATMYGGDFQPDTSVLYSDSMKFMEDIVTEYSRDDYYHEEFPAAIDWYEDDGK